MCVTHFKKLVVRIWVDMLRNVEFTDPAEELCFWITNQKSQTWIFNCRLISVHKDHFSCSAAQTQTWHKYNIRLVSRIAHLTQCTNGWISLGQGCAIQGRDIFFSMLFFLKQILQALWNNLLLACIEFRAGTESQFVRFFHKKTQSIHKIWCSQKGDERTRQHASLFYPVALSSSLAWIHNPFNIFVDYFCIIPKCYSNASI